VVIRYRYHTILWCQIPVDYVQSMNKCKAVGDVIRYFDSVIYSVTKTCITLPPSRVQWFAAGEVIFQIFLAVFHIEKIVMVVRREPVMEENFDNAVVSTRYWRAHLRHHPSFFFYVHPGDTTKWPNQLSCENLPFS